MTRIIHNGVYRLADGTSVKTVKSKTSGEFYAKRHAGSSSWRGRGGRKGTSHRWEYEAGLIKRLEAELEAGTATASPTTARLIETIDRMKADGRL